MRRREFITLLGAAASSWPLAARAQQAAMPVIGFLNSRAIGEDPHLLAAFHKGLSETGYAEGRNVAIEYRWAEGHYDRLRALAADLARREVAVIAANGPAALPARAATTTIPIVFFTGVDPVEAGIVASLSRPGGNATGVSILNTELGPKRLEFLYQLVPTATSMALLVNPTNPNAGALSRDLQAAARTLGLNLHVLHASADRDFDTVFTTVLQLRAGGLVIGADAFFTSRIRQLGTLALHYAVPAIYQYREFAAAGGLIGYGSNIADAYRQVGVYTGRILKGEKPTDLPVQQATKVEMIINFRTAKTLGITVPLTLLARADAVIE
jgi:putative ABC transport system substrate-binding protein